MPKKLTQAEFLAKAVAVHGVGRYDYSQVVYINASLKIKLACPQHGLFEQLAYLHLGGYGCQACGIKKAAATQYAKSLAAGASFMAKAHQVHGEGRYDYSLVDYFNCHTKVKILCPKHGAFEQTPTSHLSHGYGCASCGADRRGRAKRTSLELFIKQAHQVHGEGRYDYSLVDYRGGRVEIEIICPRHGVFKQVPEHHTRGSGCAKCGIEKRKLAERLSWVQLANGKLSTLYFIKLFREGEEFYKIGVTIHSVEYRYRSKLQLKGYQFEVLASHKSINAAALYDWEQAIIETFTHLRYTPQKRFGGETECFSSADEILAIFPL